MCAGGCQSGGVAAEVPPLLCNYLVVTAKLDLNLHFGLSAGWGWTAGLVAGCRNYCGFQQAANCVDERSVPGLCALDAGGLSFFYG